MTGQTDLHSLLSTVYGFALDVIEETGSYEIAKDAERIVAWIKEDYPDIAEEFSDVSDEEDDYEEDDE